MSYPRIVVTPPGPRAREIIRLDAIYSSPSTNHLYPAVFESAQDCVVRDVDGNEFIDFDSAGGIMNVGHSHPRVLKTIREQLEKATHYGYGAAYYELIPQLSKALESIVPGGGEKKFFYSNSGSEAFEAAMKAAAWHTRGHIFLGFMGSFHGRTFGALSLSGANLIHKRHFPSLAKTVSVPYPYCYRCPSGKEPSLCDCICLEILENHLRIDTPLEDVAAIALEPIQGEGCIVPPKTFFKNLRRLTEDYGILLIVDEALTGIGRTGRWLASEHWGMTPNILCVDGSLSAGLPLGLTAACSDVMDWEPGSHGSTLGGNPLACASAIAVLAIIREEHLLENATKQGRYMLRRLQDFVEKYQILGEARGEGLLMGVEVVKDKEGKEPNPEGARQIALKSWRRGLLCQTVGLSTIRFCPPLTVSQQLIDAGFEVLETAIQEVTSTGNP